jgi:hypothetical protein
VGPEKQPLLGNGREADSGMTFVAGQKVINKQEQTAAARKRLGKRVPAATDTQTKMNGVVCMGLTEEL